MSGEVVARVLAGCIDRGVREFVVCAGARNAALVLALARAEGIRVWNHFEERGAGFFALGRAMQSGRPVAVVTTSGTAAAELLPAVIEAHYQGRPLVAITADRPAPYRGSGAPQAIEQVGLFGGYVEGWDDVGEEGATSNVELSTFKRKLYEGWSGLEPWHVNVCLGEGLEVPVVEVPGGEPAVAKPTRPGVTELVEFLGGDLFRGLAVMLGGLEPEEREETYHFLEELGAPVVADAASGLRELLGKLALTDGDGILRAQPPGKVLRLGEVPVGRFWRDLEDLPEVEVLSVTRSGFSGLARETTVIEGCVHAALRGMGGAPAVGDVLDYGRRSAQRRGRLDELLEQYPDSEPALVRILSTFATVGESVYLGNSLPVREWNLCAQTAVPIVEVRANRGANGIDGQLSTWLGATAAQGGAWGVFGDLTVLYDLAAPAFLAQCEGEGRVLVVINNGGGRIFERLPRLGGLKESERALMANDHQRRFAHWAAMWEMDYMEVTGRDDFEVEPGRRPLVVELRPDGEQSDAFWEAWRARE